MVAIPLTKMRKTFRDFDRDMDVYVDDRRGDWAVYYERDMDSRAYKIIKVERWINADLGFAYPPRKVMRISHAQDELDAFMQAMRILEGLDK